MARKLSNAAAEALAATDWTAIDAMTDTDIAGQIARNRDLRSIRRRMSTSGASGVQPA
jgi:hypothetical protein